MLYPAPMHLSRRSLLAAAATLPLASPALAQSSTMPFEQWVASFRPRAISRGISGTTYDRVFGTLKPDQRVFALQKSQPEFREQLWQYLNRRVSEWRLIEGAQKLRQHDALLTRIEREYGVDRYILLALWGVESAYGDPLVHQNHMRPVFPSLAALAWGEPRRRPYWETELLNALVVVDRGWSTPDEMRGSWAGAMGHTQWMPEVWLNLGVDYGKDGRVSPFGDPADALATSAKFLLNRGRYRRNEPWGCEVRRAPAGAGEGMRTYAAWQEAGATRADGKPFAMPQAQAKLWTPVAGGPSFLIGANLNALKAYNPSINYALAICHLSDRLRGEGPFITPFPGAEARAPTLAEVQEVQRRLTEQGFDTGGVDGRVGNDTMLAVRNFQRKVGLAPADGYAGLTVLARLRQSR